MISGKHHLLSALIPAYNEEDTVAETVESLRKIKEIDEIIVIDDGSSDSTGERAREAGAYLVASKENLGKGGALNLGLAKAKGDIILLVDADTGTSASEIEPLIGPVLRGEADMAVGILSRKSGKKGGFGLAVKLARAGIRLLTGKRPEAPLSGQRVLRRSIIEAAGGFENGFGVEVGLTLAAIRQGARVAEIPIGICHRETGRDLRGFLHRGRQFWSILKVLMKCLLFG